MDQEFNFTAICSNKTVNKVLLTDFLFLILRKIKASCSQVKSLF